MPVTVPDIHEAVGKGLLKEENEISDLTAGKPQNSRFSLHQIQFLLLSLNVQNVSWQSSLGYAMATCGSEQTFLSVSALWLSTDEAQVFAERTGVGTVPYRAALMVRCTVMRTHHTPFVRSSWTWTVLENLYNVLHDVPRETGLPS